MVTKFVLLDGVIDIPSSAYWSTSHGHPTIFSLNDTSSLHPTQDRSVFGEAREEVSVDSEERPCRAAGVLITGDGRGYVHTQIRTNVMGIVKSTTGIVSDGVVLLLFPDDPTRNAGVGLRRLVKGTDILDGSDVKGLLHRRPVFGIRSHRAGDGSGVG